MAIMANRSHGINPTNKRQGDSPCFAKHRLGFTTLENIVVGVAIRLSWTYVPQLTAVLAGSFACQAAQIRSRRSASQSATGRCRTTGRPSPWYACIPPATITILSKPCRSRSQAWSCASAPLSETRYSGSVSSNSRVQTSFSAEISAEDCFLLLTFCEERGQMHPAEQVVWGFKLGRPLLLIPRV